MTTLRFVWIGTATLAVAVLLGTLATIGAGEATLAFDVWWNDLMISLRADGPLAVAQALNWIGGGWRAIILLPALLLALVLLLRGWRAAVFALAAFVMSVLLVQVLKNLFDRARPEELLVLSDHGSYPSGHTANAATIALVLWLLFPRVWVGVIGIVWTVAMALSRTMLSVHWAVDTIGGALVGAAGVLFVAAMLLPWARAQTPKSVE